MWFHSVLMLLPNSDSLPQLSLDARPLTDAVFIFSFPRSIMLPSKSQDRLNGKEWMDEEDIWITACSLCFFVFWQTVSSQKCLHNLPSSLRQRECSFPHSHFQFIQSSFPCFLPIKTRRCPKSCVFMIFPPSEKSCWVAPPTASNEIASGPFH